MEVFEKFYADSKLQGNERDEAFEAYVALMQKSNLGSYLYFHLSDAEWSEVQPFLNKISTHIEHIRDEKRMDWYGDENNWNDYDPTHLVQLSENFEETNWMADFFRKCTKAIIESDYSTCFAIPDAYKIRTGRMEDYRISPNTAIKHLFQQNNPGYKFELLCQKDGAIIVHFNWSHDGIAPIEIYGIEYFDRLLGENEEIPDIGEKTMTDLVEGQEDLGCDIVTLPSGKELIFTE